VLRLRKTHGSRDIERTMSGILAPYRVLDLTNERGLLCGQILGDLGADVVQVEPPGGSSARRLGPFLADEPGPDRSLYWWAYNRNKRGVTLDWRRDEGRAILLELVRGADFLIESEVPGALEEHGLDFAALSAVNPKLIYVSITAFGQDGPKMNYADADLVILAAGGPLLLTGDDDRPPVRLSAVPQAYLHACADAAVGALVAHHERVRSGLGQHVDVSAQQSVAMATQSYILSAAVDSPEIGRISGGVKLGALRIPLVWKAKDGYVSLTFLFGSALGPFSQRLMDYVCEQGFCDEATRDKDWIGYLELLMSGKEPIEEWERVRGVLERFTESRTKAELLELAINKGFLIAPVSTIQDVVGSPQLAAREYFQPLDHAEHGRSFLYPGPFVRFSDSPIRYRRRPPSLGEHNGEIYGQELGMSEAKLAALAKKGIV
jgi:crotonobetainyl-CoA:carnitine CoA-transferase CaiB-like acyl-CoA transferase